MHVTGGAMLCDIHGVVQFEIVITSAEGNLHQVLAEVLVEYIDFARVKHHKTGVSVLSFSQVHDAWPVVSPKFLGRDHAVAIEVEHFCFQ